MFLPHISLEDMEQVFFSKVLPKVGQLQLTVELSVSPVLEPAWIAVILLLGLHSIYGIQKLKFYSLRVFTVLC